jgi:nucleoside-diphosphate-sugar epimerase
VKTNNGHQFELVTINPSLVLGQCRTTPGTSVDIVRQLMTGEMSRLPAMNLGIVDVKDVAEAQIAALKEKQAAGQRFLLSNKIVSMRDLADMLAEEFQPRGVSVTTKRLPYWLAWTLSWFVGSLRGTVKDWDSELHVDGSKAERTFGFKYADLKTTLRETGESLIDAGLVKPKK